MAKYIPLTVIEYMQELPQNRKEFLFFSDYVVHLIMPRTLRNSTNIPTLNTLPKSVHYVVSQHTIPANSTGVNPELTDIALLLFGQNRPSHYFGSHHIFNPGAVNYVDPYMKYCNRITKDDCKMYCNGIYVVLFTRFLFETYLCISQSQTHNSKIFILSGHF